MKPNHYASPDHLPDSIFALLLLQRDLSMEISDKRFTAPGFDLDAPILRIRNQVLRKQLIVLRSMTERLGMISKMEREPGKTDIN